MKNIIEKISKIVEKDCKKQKNYYGYNAWVYHINVVYNNSLKLAKKIKADQEIVALSVLLHDYSCILDKKLYKEHHTHSARIAERLLKQFNYPEDKIEKVKNCIKSHRASIKTTRNTKEAKCLASADAMSHIQKVVDLLFLAFSIYKMDVKEGSVFVLNKIDKSWKKLMPEAKKMIKNDYCNTRRVLLEVINLQKVFFVEQNRILSF